MKKSVVELKHHITLYSFAPWFLYFSINLLSESIFSIFNSRLSAKIKEKFFVIKKLDNIALERNIESQRCMTLMIL